MQPKDEQNYHAAQQPPPPYQQEPPGSYAPPASFAPPANMIGGQSVTIVQPSTYAVAPLYTPVGSKPTVTNCRTCQAQIVTRTEYRPTVRTHLMALLLCICICWPCVCVPYCVDSCNNVDHYCPNCNAFIGSYN